MSNKSSRALYMREYRKKQKEAMGADAYLKQETVNRYKRGYTRTPDTTRTRKCNKYDLTWQKKDVHSCEPDEVVYCFCGSKVLLKSFPGHVKTKKHNNYVKTEEKGATGDSKEKTGDSKEKMDIARTKDEE